MARMAILDFLFWILAFFNNLFKNAPKKGKDQQRADKPAPLLEALRM